MGILFKYEMNLFYIGWFKINKILKLDMYINIIDRYV